MITITKLSDNIRLVCEYIPNLRSASMGFFVRAGSVNETAKNNGISHFLEHMMFKGTDSLSAYDISTRFEDIGASFNAYTSHVNTCYYVKTIDVHVEEVFSMLAEVFTSAVFPEKELQKEKGVVLSEIARDADDPEDVCLELLQKKLFQGSPLARPILGSAKNVKGFTREDLLNYRKEKYCSGNIVISIAGCVSPQLAQQLAEKYVCGKMTYSAAFLPFAEPKIDFSAGEITRFKNVNQSNVAIGFPLSEKSNASLFEISLALAVLGEGSSSRLFLKLREELGLVYDVYAYKSNYTNNGMAEIYLGTNPADTQKAVLAAKSVLEGLRKDGVTDAEFLRSKEQLKAGVLYCMESSVASMKVNGRRMINSDDMYEVEQELAVIDAITKDDVNEHFSFIDFNLANVSYVGKRIDYSLLNLLQ